MRPKLTQTYPTCYFFVVSPLENARLTCFTCHIPGFDVTRETCVQATCCNFSLTKSVDNAAGVMPGMRRACPKV